MITRRGADAGHAQPMMGKRARRLGRAVRRSMAQLVDGHSKEIIQRLDRIEASMSQRKLMSNADLERLRSDIWHSKVVNVGRYLLVGSRHLNMIFLIDPDDRMIGPRFVLEGEYEPETTQFFLQNVRSDNVCVDVGANFGYYSCLLGQLAWQGKVVSFEPDPIVYEQLRDNVLINWCERAVETVNAAVGQSSEPLVLFRRKHRSGNSGLIRPTSDDLTFLKEPDPEQFEIDCVTLDSIANRLDRVDFVKIDVEGAETLVVSGMEELVRHHHPTIVMEWSPDQTAAAGFSTTALAALLEGLDLDPHALEPDGGLRPLTYETLLALPFQNIVFTPAARRRA